MLVARLLGRPIIVVAGGYDVANVPSIQYGNMQGGMTRLLGRLAFRLASRVLAFSGSAALETERFAGVPRDKIRTLYLAFDSNRLGADVPAPVKERFVLTVGHLNSNSIVRKGVLTLVRASRLMPDEKFVIAGHGDADTMRRLKAEAGVNVVFAGAVTDEARNDLLRRAKVYCQASVHEGFGAAVAEAMLFNCVPVVSPTGSLPEVAGPHARFVDSGDAVALASALRSALDAGGDEGESGRAYIIRSFNVASRRTGLFQALNEACGFTGRNVT
jgi:glycosyltransferase involved in cell wall biosynthesis